MLLSSPYRQSFWRPDDVASTMRFAMADYQRSVGRRLEALRRQRNLSQEDAAHRAGVSLTTWRNWARGKSAPYERNWQKVQKAFGLEDSDIGAIRGAPPTPLGLGPENGGQAQLDRIESLLRDIATALNVPVAPLDPIVEEMAQELGDDGQPSEQPDDEDDEEKPPQTGTDPES